MNHPSLPRLFVSTLRCNQDAEIKIMTCLNGNFEHQTWTPQPNDVGRELDHEITFQGTA